jgi:hypothetical protein
MSSAQAAYSATRGGAYGSLDCLLTPASCPVEGEATPPTPFLSADAGDPGPRSGYRFELLVPEDGHGFTYWAAPDNFNVSGNRAFCVDSTGVVQEYLTSRDGPSPPDDSCPLGGRPLM